MEARIRLSPVQEPDQSIDGHFPPCLQPQEFFLRIDRIAQLHNFRQYPHIGHLPGPRPDPITNRRQGAGIAGFP